MAALEWGRATYNRFILNSQTAIWVVVFAETITKLREPYHLAMPIRMFLGTNDKKSWCLFFVFYQKLCYNIYRK